MHNKEEKCEETTVRNVPYMKANKKQQETLQKETPIKGRQKKNGAKIKSKQVSQYSIWFGALQLAGACYDFVILIHPSIFCTWMMFTFYPPL